MRYEREQPGELIHIDIKKLGRIDGVGHRITGDRTGQSNRRAAGRGLGWEYLHVAIDDRSRLAFTQLLPSERKEDATAFLESSPAWFKQHGVTVQHVMTDNGSAYKSRLFAAALDNHGVVHKRTRPYTPKTNGKVERFPAAGVDADRVHQHLIMWSTFSLVFGGLTERALAGRGRNVQTKGTSSTVRRAATPDRTASPAVGCRGNPTGR